MAATRLPDRLNPDYLGPLLLRGDRAALARAITLVESRKIEHRSLAASLIDHIIGSTGNAKRIGITGVPGVGKSTTIDAFGSYLTAQGQKVAVLAVDPSSTRTGGSILGDKTRMNRLAIDPNAFVRPSPSAKSLGGVAAKTRETMLLCEAAGFDVIIVETVGVGQSETAVADMVDSFVMLALPGAGDELQGIKKGILEIADMIAVNKADGDNRRRAEMAASDYRSALRILAPSDPHWSPAVTLLSGLEGTGLDALAETLDAHIDAMKASGQFAHKRKRQQVRWMWTMIEERLREALTRDEAVTSQLQRLEHEVETGKRSPTSAAAEAAQLVGL